MASISVGWSQIHLNDVITIVTSNGEITTHMTVTDGMAAMLNTVYMAVYLICCIATSNHGSYAIVLPSWTCGFNKAK